MFAFFPHYLKHIDCSRSKVDLFGFVSSSGPANLDQTWKSAFHKILRKKNFCWRHPSFWYDKDSGGKKKKEL